MIVVCYYSSAVVSTNRTPIHYKSYKHDRDERKSRQRNELRHDSRLTEQWTRRDSGPACCCCCCCCCCSLSRTHQNNLLLLSVQCWWKPAHDDTTAAAVRRVPFYTGHRASRRPAIPRPRCVLFRRRAHRPTDRPPPFSCNVRKRYNAITTLVVVVVITAVVRRCCCFLVGGELYSIFFLLFTRLHLRWRHIIIIFGEATHCSDDDDDDDK